MRALLVGAAPAQGAALPLRDLAAEVDLVVAVDGGGERLVRAGVTPDLAIGDFDSLPTDILASLDAHGVEVVRHPAEKDESDLSLALSEVSSRGVSEVVLTGFTGGRLDHTLVVAGALARAAALRPHIVETAEEGWILAPGARSSVEPGVRGDTISVIALAGGTVVSVSGVHWPLEHAVLDPLGDLGLSNRITGPDAVVTVHSGLALVLRPSLNG